MEQKIIGRVERVFLPDLLLNNLDAKIDTGAFSSSLHCEDIVVDRKNHMVSFKVSYTDNNLLISQAFKKTLFEQRRVKSSNGEIQLRAFIKTKIKICKIDYNIIISLTDRSKMKYPMLIGRNFLKNKFIVDVSKVYLSKGEKC